MEGERIMEKKSDVIKEILHYVIVNNTDSAEVEDIILELIERYGKALYEETLENGKNNL